jgi:hypothetical protein
MCVAIATRLHAFLFRQNFEADAQVSVYRAYMEPARPGANELKYDFCFAKQGVSECENIGGNPTYTCVNQVLYHSVITNYDRHLPSCSPQAIPLNLSCRVKALKISGDQDPCRV